VSVFYDDAADGPQLIDVLNGLPLEPTGITFDEQAGLAYLSVFARTATTGLPRTMLRVGLSVQPEAGFEASFAYDAGAVVIDGVAQQRDTRAVAVNLARTPAEGQVLVASRDPAAVLFVDMSASGVASVPETSVVTRRIVPVGAGPSRLASGRIGDREIVAVSCFDGHAVYVLDVKTAQVLGIVHNLNGPFELGIDGGRKLMYLADFRTSSVQVIDLEPLTSAGPDTDPRILGTLGIPKVVQELQ
jgi:DNA-binding beta-propeller fold protein YncE